MRHHILNMFLGLLWIALVVWLLGCSGCGHTRIEWSADDIGHAVYAARYDEISDRATCRIVDRIESGGPGQPRWIVFEDDNDNPIPLSYFPDATEGSGVCTEPSPADVADLRAPWWVFECAEQGIDPLDCNGPNGGGQ